MSGIVQCRHYENLAHGVLVIVIHFYSFYFCRSVSLCGGKTIFLPIVSSFNLRKKLVFRLRYGC